ncbi:MAG: TIGR03960 family B12-binding radical SAM protein [Oscillospiraceae bacterium]|nr:TIGR03960 family B12-binding radical SAM protein [Oscillospiraceae bacterium]
MNNKLERILPNVQKPARYVGGEYGQTVKDKASVDLRVAFCFPDTYEIGMSNLGMRILYAVMNQMDGVWCERVFAPWADMEEAMIQNDIPLYALESGDPISDFDMIAFTIGYEMSYTNVLNMLRLGNIPLHASERKGLSQMVFAGGACMYNPEPLADFVDFFCIGEGEEMTPEILNLYRKAKREGWTKDAFLCEVCKIEGVYVPSLYEHIYGDQGELLEIRVKEGAPKQIRKRIIQNLDTALYPTEGIVPNLEIVHDRSNLEVMRGCIRGCRFCQAGFTYRPVRPRSPKLLQKQAVEALEFSGCHEITLSSLSTSDYYALEELAGGMLDYCTPRKISLSLPSLRADNFSRELMLKLQQVKKSGLTFAPEAGTQRLRDAINKNVTEEEILHTCAIAFSGGWNSVKLYFMLGLPTETDEDVLGIADLVYKIYQTWRENASNKKRGVRIHVATAFFVPKPFTPFQWEKQITPEEYLRRTKLLKANMPAKFVEYKYHEADLSRLEAVLARGDRRLGAVLEEAVNRGCRLDAWDEYFNYSAWCEAFDCCKIDPDHYTVRGFEEGELLPWQTISDGVSTAFLSRERKKAYASETTADCRSQCAGCGANCLLEGGKCNA